ncbi:MAG TPA: DUF4296 domain-containing protein [Flavobacteriales bacterium]
MKGGRLALGLLLMACGRSEQQAPDDLLPRQKFEQVLGASLLIEARLNHEMVLDRRADSPVRRYYEEMFAEQGVTEEAFKRTYDHYVAHPAELKGIYEDVLQDLQQRADSIKH